MATQIEIKTVAQANKQFTAKLEGATTKLRESHAALVWALLNAVDTQDVSQLQAMREQVADYHPTLVSRFDFYVTNTLDGVDVARGEYEAESFTLSDQAVLSSPWNTHAKPNNGKAEAKPVDPRVSIKQLTNKLAKQGLADSYKAKAAQQVADVLARAMAELEAIHAGTYGKVAKPAKAAAQDVANVVAIKAA